MRYLAVLVLAVSCQAVTWIDIAENWLTDCPVADLNGDGIVNFIDYGLVINMPVPKYELNNTSELLVWRDSIGFDENFEQIAADNARTKNITLASRPVMVQDDTNIGYRVFFTDGDLIVLTDGTDLYTTTVDDFGDGTNPTYTKIVDVDVDEPFATNFASGDYAFSAAKMDNGNWVLCVGQQGAGEYGTFYYSGDKGQSWNECKFADDTLFVMEQGLVDFWGWAGIRGSEVIIGEYNLKDQADNPRRVYYSSDYGVTWAKIYEPTAQSGQHCHTVSFGPTSTDEIYVSYGDGDYGGIYKLEFTGTDKTNPDHWTDTGMVHRGQPTAAYTHGGYIYWGRDGSSQRDGVIYRSDADGKFETVLEVFQTNDKFGVPYHHGQPGVDVFSITSIGNVLYAGAISGSGNRGGLYVSKTGADWVRVWRGTANSNFDGMSFVAGLAGGKVWGTVLEASASISASSKIAYFDAVNAIDFDGVYNEMAVTNLLSANDSGDFDTVTGWTPQPGSLAVESSTDDALYGTKAVKVTGLATANDVYLLSPTFNATEGRLYCAKFRIKANGAGTRVAPRWRYSEMTQHYEAMILNSQWQEVTVWGRCDTTKAAMAVRLDFYGVTDSAEWLIDTFRIYESATGGHYNASWQLGGTARDTEILAYSLSLGREHSVAFDWQPKTGYLDFASQTDGVDTIGEDVAIGSIIGPEGEIDIYWDHTDSKIAITDGTTTVKTTEVYEFLHNDFIRIGVTSDGTDSVLYVEDGVNGFASTAATGIALRGVVALKPGNVYAEDKLQVGVFGRIRGFDSELSESDMQTMFKTVTPAIAPAAGGSVGTRFGLIGDRFTR